MFPSWWDHSSDCVCHKKIYLHQIIPIRYGFYEVIHLVGKNNAILSPIVIETNINGSKSHPSYLELRVLYQHVVNPKKSGNWNHSLLTKNITTRNSQYFATATGSIFDSPKRNYPFLKNKNQQGKHDIVFVMTFTFSLLCSRWFQRRASFSGPSTLALTWAPSAQAGSNSWALQLWLLCWCCWCWLCRHLGSYLRW